MTAESTAAAALRESAGVMPVTWSQRAVSIVREAGSRAAEDAPLAWLRMEPDGDRAAVRLVTWPGEEDRLLARAGYHGTPVELS